MSCLCHDSSHHTQSRSSHTCSLVVTPHNYPLCNSPYGQQQCRSQVLSCTNRDTNAVVILFEVRWLGYYILSWLLFQKMPHAYHKLNTQNHCNVRLVFKKCCTTDLKFKISDYLAMGKNESMDCKMLWDIAIVIIYRCTSSIILFLRSLEQNFSKKLMVPWYDKELLCLPYWYYCSWCIAIHWHIKIHWHISKLKGNSE